MSEPMNICSSGPVARVAPWPCAAESTKNSEMLLTLTILLVYITVLVKLSMFSVMFWPATSVYRECMCKGLGTLSASF